MKLRSYLIALVVVALLPVVIFSGVMIYMAYQDQRDDAERGNVLGQPLDCFIPLICFFLLRQNWGKKVSRSKKEEWNDMEGKTEQRKARHRTILRTAMEGFWRVDLIPARRSEK